MPRFFELRNAARDRTELFTEGQLPRARAAGYTDVLFDVEGPSRAYAWRARDSRRSGRDYSYSPDMDGDYGLEPLTEAELVAVVLFVRALVDRDDEALAAAGAYGDGRDPYLWTTDYGPWDRVDLQVPPGAPEHWSGGVLRISPARTAVVVDLWTAQEGPSDLSLEIAVETSGPGPRVVFEDLHVM